MTISIISLCDGLDTIFTFNFDSRYNIKAKNIKLNLLNENCVCCLYVRWRKHIWMWCPITYTQ